MENAKLKDSIAKLRKSLSDGGAGDDELLSK